MKDIPCPKCKAPMKRTENLFEPNLDTYLCVACGAKRSIPKKSDEKIAKERMLGQLDRERAESEGIMPDIDITPKPFPLTKKAPTEEKEEKEIPKTREKDSISKVKNLSRDIKRLSDEIKGLKADLEIKDIEIREIKKTARSFAKGIAQIINEMRSAGETRIKTVETLLSDLEKQIKE